MISFVKPISCLKRLMVEFIFCSQVLNTIIHHAFIQLLPNLAFSAVLFSVKKEGEAQVWQQIWIQCPSNNMYTTQSCWYPLAHSSANIWQTKLVHQTFPTIKWKTSRPRFHSFIGKSKGPLQSMFTHSDNFRPPDCNDNIANEIFIFRFSVTYTYFSGRRYAFLKAIKARDE